MVVGQADGFGAELRRRREAAGHSQSSFAKLIHYSKGYLSKVETGKARGNREFAKACESALEAGGALLALMREKGERSRGAVTALTGLPPATPQFVGRAAELTRIGDVLADEPGPTTCVLSGMAGAGKTALALRAAWSAVDTFPDGCVFLDLAGYSPDTDEAAPYDVLGPLLRLLGVPPEQIPAHIDARSNVYQGQLRGRRFLLVFDNVRRAAQVLPLLPAEPRCRVIITSRNRLNALDDAVHLPVDVLPPPEASALFRSVAGERAVNTPDELVERVAQYCGGLPLAIRIAAARIRGGGSWTPAELIARLADETVRFDVLDDGERSVAAAFAMSCRMLPSDQLTLLGLLATYPGREVEIRNVAALADISLARSRSLVSRLGEAHLVSELEPDRFALHDLVKEFARDQVLSEISADERTMAVRRMIDHNLLLAMSSDEHLSPHRYRMPFRFDSLPSVSERFADDGAARDWVESEWPTLVGLCRLAAANGLHDRCWRMAYLLRDFFFRTKLWDPWIDTHLVAASSARDAGDRKALAITLNNLGIAHVDRGDLATAVGYYEEALELFRDVADHVGVTNAVSNLAWATLYAGDHAAALNGLGEASRAYQELGNERNAAIALRGMALAETELGRFAEALEHALRSRDTFVALGLDLDTVMSLNCIAWVHFQAGDHTTAATHYEGAVALGGRCGSGYETARALVGLGNVRAAGGHRAEAAEIWARADKLHDLRDPVMLGEVRTRYAF